MKAGCRSVSVFRAKVCSTVHHVVDYGPRHRDLSNLSVIGIDKTSRKKGINI
jgi:hypothetical protein